jgi:hypothetical protein
MSTCYNLRCLDCDSTGRIDDSYGTVCLEDVQKVIKNRVTILALVADGMDVKVDGHAALPIEWLNKHCHHRLAPISDNGRIEIIELGPVEPAGMPRGPR